MVIVLNSAEVYKVCNYEQFCKKMTLSIFDNIISVFEMNKAPPKWDFLPCRYHARSLEKEKYSFL